MSKSRPNFTHFDPPVKIRGGVGEISGLRFLHLTGVVFATAENISLLKKLENVSIANALQLEAARRRAVPIRFNFGARAKLVEDRPLQSATEM